VVDPQESRARLLRAPLGFLSPNRASLSSDSCTAASTTGAGLATSLPVWLAKVTTWSYGATMAEAGVRSSFLKIRALADIARRRRLGAEPVGGYDRRSGAALTRTKSVWS